MNSRQEAIVHISHADFEHWGVAVVKEGQKTANGYIWVVEYDTIWIIF